MKHESTHPSDEFYELLQPALASKAEEFLLLGYGKVKHEELWRYLTKKKWIKMDRSPVLYQLVADILALKIGDYMNFATVEAFRSPNLFANIESDEMQELLNPQQLKDT